MSALILCAGHAKAQPQLDSAETVFRNDAGAERAEAHYRRALALFDEGRFAEALAEFHEANHAAPHFGLHYNIAITELRLADRAAALKAFELYLEHGGTEIAPDRVSAVQSEIARLSSELASISVEVEANGSVITLDGETVGAAPLISKLRVNPGRHVITCSSAKAVQKREFEVQAGETLVVRFQEPKQETISRSAPVTARLPSDEKLEQTRPVPWIPWAVTGAFAATTAFTAILTLNARSDELDIRERSRVSRNDYEDARAKVERLALATDICAGLTVASGAFSLYLTLSKPKTERASVRSVEIHPVSNGLQVRGAF